MTIKEYVSHLFNYRIPNGTSGWDEMDRVLGKNGTWSITGSPSKFQKIVLELLKRVEKLEYEESKRH